MVNTVPLTKFFIISQGAGLNFDSRALVCRTECYHDGLLPFGGAGSHLLQLDEVKDLAKEYQVTPAALLLAWVMRKIT